MKRKPKTYEAIFEPGKNKGVYGISLVENPAMQGHFLALSDVEEPIQLKTVNEEERILIGLVLEPNKAVYRRQEDEEFYVVFSADTIKELSYNFYKGGFHSNSSVEHSSEIDGVTFVESWIIADTNNDKSSALGLSYPVGSWMATMKVDSDEVWNDYVKSGKVKGFSIDALVTLKEVNFKNEINMSSEKGIIDAINKGFENFMAYFKTQGKDINLGEVKAANEDVDIQFEGDKLTVGGRVWILAEDETEVPLPAGEYPLEDNTTLVVTEEGKVGEIKQPEEPAAPAAPVETAELSAEGSEKLAKTVENTIKSIMIKYQSDSKKEIEDLKAQVLELSNQPAAKKIKAVPTQTEAKTAKERILQTIQDNK